MKLQIKPFTLDLVPAAKEFTDISIGENYYTPTELIEAQKKSVASTGEITSFVLLDEHNRLQGIRLAYPPGNWTQGKSHKLRPELWPFPLERAAYFQSLFIAEDTRGSGLGPQLSNRAIEIFKSLGALGIVTHCWKESPNNSSFRYLEKMGFKPVIEYPDYWVDVQYTCTRDGYPCHCTAIEMVKTL